MSLFNLFKKKTTDVVEVLEEKEKTTTSDVSKELFIEEVATGKEELFEAKNYNLDKIYAFASKDFEEKGYDDALVNPDYSYSNDNIKLLKYDFQILIKRAYKTYEDYIKDIEFHIQSRSNAGLIDTVKLLETTLMKTKDSIEEVKVIEEDFSNEVGLIERISLSYKRGFMRGLAAMSDQILDKNV
ncbi:MULTISPECIES: hypothetical protein [unclassified Tenacibaculum]|uniref:hypothetical protein n=1 Tax=unclassified Tenacibaculum TaxID=2635139 RepID=UPI001F28EBD2|nr:MULTISPECIES: hypothetical protein [unclassified Tenacibaculum]MCF2875074.1 hypothetical protein [Tenacibaculum sp. Cn5-1]MCF2935150.1 hypothetical protein [Tenacibaculum sp. Cn5-34]MCG7511408.1 hypothetical protein [Tenacibaculum sp. Cn5-46]